QQYNFKMNKPASKIYRTTNWSSYNRALINRGNISIWFDPKTQWYAQSQGKQGRNQTYSDTAIQCCLMIKLLFRLSLRMVTGFVQSLVIRSPSYPSCLLNLSSLRELSLSNLYATKPLRTKSLNLVEE